MKCRGGGGGSWQRSRSGARRGIAYGSEGQRVNLDTEGSNVLLLELASQVALDEGGLSYRLR
jgi:hypothetical protein